MRITNKVILILAAIIAIIVVVTLALRNQDYFTDFGLNFGEFTQKLFGGQ